MEPIRIFLLAGLVAHKVLWELMKRGVSTVPQPRKLPLAVKAVKALKVAVLLGLIVQTAFLSVLPISRDPRALQTAGLAIYVAGLLTAMAARLQLGRNWLDIENADVLPTQAVVCAGVYRYVRHPIYIADLLLILGLELALNSWLAAGVLLLAPVVVRMAMREEALLRARLAGYEAYCRRTKRFIPFVV